MGPSSERSGVAWAAAAYLWWGLFPLYFRTLAAVPAPEILAHRILWSAVFVTLLASATRHWAAVLRQLRSPGTLPTLAASAVLISTNWLIYIWSVNSGHVLDASLGYFVNPLVTVCFGVLFLRDPLTRLQAIAVALAAGGVLVLAVRGGHVPWVALALAVTFASYGLLRKRARVDATAGLLAEVGLLAPLALAYALALGIGGRGHFGRGAGETLLLASTGVATAVPLLWFAMGVQRLRLSTVGLLQYLNPTVQFAIAVFAFREPFTAAHAVAFGCIWVSLALYSAEALAVARRLAAAKGRAGEAT